MPNRVVVYSLDSGKSNDGMSFVNASENFYNVTLRVVDRTSMVYHLDAYDFGLVFNANRVSFAKVLKGGICVQSFKHLVCAWNEIVVDGPNDGSRCSVFCVAPYANDILGDKDALKEKASVKAVGVGDILLFYGSMKLFHLEQVGLNFLLTTNF